LQIAENIGRELNADLEILHAAALLHDASGADPAEGEGRTTHEQNSASFAGEVLGNLGWDESRIASVQHCIKAHRYRGKEEPESLEAQILFDADKLDVVGAFGVARTIGYAIQAKQPIFAEPSEQFIESGEKEANEPHSSYHEYLFKLQRVKDRLYTEQAKDMAEMRFQVMKSFFEQLALEARGVG
jgi:uncharacterized protein